jgi:hypothetical protein
MSISAPQKQRESIRELNRHPVANPKMTCFQTLRARSRRYSWKSTCNSQPQVASKGRRRIEEVKHGGCPSRPRFEN